MELHHLNTISIDGEGLGGALGLILATGIGIAISNADPEA